MIPTEKSSNFIDIFIRIAIRVKILQSMANPGYFQTFAWTKNFDPIF